MDLVAQLLIDVETVLLSFGFRRHPATGVRACWVRRKLRHNRAVVVIECPGDEDPAIFARQQKSASRKAAGFFIPGLYEIGLQIIVLGPPAITNPTDVVDTFSNQICVLQAVHLVDLRGRLLTSGSTWGQDVTGEIQEALVATLQGSLDKSSPTYNEAQAESATFEDYDDAARVPILWTVPTPRWSKTIMIAHWISLIAALLALLLRFGLR